MANWRDIRSVELDERVLFWVPYRKHEGSAHFGFAWLGRASGMVKFSIEGHRGDFAPTHWMPILPPRGATELQMTVPTESGQPTAPRTESVGGGAAQEGE